MLLTPEQILEIQKIIELHHNAFIANTIGHGAIPDEVLKDLKEKGLLKEDVLHIVKEAYLYGTALTKINDENASKMSYSQFRAYMKKNPIPLSSIEKRAVVMAQVSAGQYCKGLGNTVQKDTQSLLIEADKQLRIRFEDDIKNTAAINIGKRESIEKLKSDLGWKTADWGRDLKRIAVTEIGFARHQGQADSLKQKYSGEDIFVARIPNPDACEHCVRLFLGPDGQPRIFKLSTLEANGSNVGRKARDWRPVIGPIHPNCVCPMIRIPNGWGFNESGEVIPNGKLGVVYKEPEELELALKEELSLKKAFSTSENKNIIFQGIPIVIETSEGVSRNWINSDGSVGEITMYGASYGYIKNTTSMDEEELDVFIGPYSGSTIVYIIDQRKPDNDLYDEQKCMLGFRDEEHAISVYRANYINSDSFFLGIASMSLDQFKRWVGLGNLNKSDGRSPGSNLGINYVISFPKKKKKKNNTGYAFDADAYFHKEVTPTVRDKKIYEIDNSRIIEHGIIPIEKEIDEEDIKDNKNRIKKELNSHIGIVNSYLEEQ
jgi:hypothetical protein